MLRGLGLLAAVAVPLSVSLWLSYRLTVNSAWNDLQRVADASARRAAAILDDGKQRLHALNQELSGDCGAADRDALARAGFDSLYYREAGLVRGGALHCTSFQMFDPPMAIPRLYLERREVYRDGLFELRQPQPTVMGGHSMIVLEYTDASNFDYANLLLDLDQFAELINYFENVDGGIFLTYDREAVSQVAGPPMEGIDPLAGVQQRNAQGDLIAVAQAEPYPIATVIRLPHSALLARWRSQSQPAALLGVVLTALALLALRRWLPSTPGLRAELAEGIQRGELEIHYQPVIDAGSGLTLSAEALVRWRHPRHGLLYPDRFIDIAEQQRLMAALTSAVLQQVAAALPRLPDTLRIAINLPPQLLRDGSIIELLNLHFGPEARLSRLTLEVTERELIEYADADVLSTVQQLRERDAKISLDDFGTGFSGLSQLRHLKPQQIKIDRSFIRALGSEAVTAALVDAVVAMTGTLGVELVAEGVETATQRDLLMQRGIHAQQGWLYAKAMPIDALLRFVHTPAPHTGKARASAPLSTSNHR